MVTSSKSASRLVGLQVRKTPSAPVATCYQQVTGVLSDLLQIDSRCWLGRLSVIVISKAWLVGIRVTSTALLPELQVVYRRELGVLDAGLPALEVFQVDLGDLDARMAHESGEA